MTAELAEAIYRTSIRLEGDEKDFKKWKVLESIDRDFRKDLQCTLNYGYRIQQIHKDVNSSHVCPHTSTMMKTDIFILAK